MPKCKLRKIQNIGQASQLAGSLRLTFHLAGCIRQIRVLAQCQAEFCRMSRANVSAESSILHTSVTALMASASRRAASGRVLLPLARKSRSACRKACGSALPVALRRTQATSYLRRVSNPRPPSAALPACRISYHHSEPLQPVLVYNAHEMHRCFTDAGSKEAIALDLYTS